ncbi:MAG: carbohydrate kinase [Chloroflexi bacterium]|nr:carbohydrate kinase [Chloroflexota bacterium]
MAHRTIITVDVGTSSTKTALWDDAGALLAEASAAYTLHRPDPLRAEIDGDVWWQAVCTTIRQVMAQSGTNPRDVAGIGVDGVGWTLLPVDRSGDPLHRALIWLDRRAEDETRWLRSLPDAEKLVNLAANPLDAAYITPKLLWLKNHHPEVFEPTHQFLTASGFIVGRFTGEFTCDYTQAYGYHCFDIRNECWDADTAARLGIPLDKLPRLYPCTEIVGTVTEHAAADCGLVTGIPVIAGCLDAASGALGAGVTRVQQTNEQGGQAGGMAVSLDHVVVEPQLIFSHHVLPGQYLLQGGTVGGGTLGWFRDVLGQVESNEAALTGQSVFELFSRQATLSPPGAHGLIFIAYMAGERTPLWNSAARGVFFGLSYATTRADLLRAIMEGCAFAVYDNVQIARAHGVVITEYLGSGGATQSAVWCQIKADVYGAPFIVARRADGGEGGHSLGLYALAASAVGLCDDAGACVERLLPQRQVFEPSPQRHALYQDIFQVYRNVSRKLLGDFDELAAVMQRYSPNG